jgi:putative ABC transport system permease protein
MFKIIFLTAYRSLIRYKNITLINLLGLVLGITSFLFIQHYLVYEFSYDSFFPSKENIYRINLKVEKEDQVIYNGAKTPRGLFFALKNGIPEIEANGISYFEYCLVKYGDISFTNQDVLWIDEGFEEVFPLKMIEGHVDYSRPMAGIISVTMARSFFGDYSSALGKILSVNEGMPVEITGVFQDLPSNSHLKAHYFMTIKTWVEMGYFPPTGDWRWNGWWNYIRISEGSNSQIVSQKINSLAQNHMGFLEEENRTAHFSLQPLSELHFVSDLSGETGVSTKRSSLYNLIAIVMVTLMIAWINYVNLSIAHAHARAVQIKMRKLIGASNAHLWHLSLAESILLNLSALGISLFLYFSLLSRFARLFHIPIEQAHIPETYMILISVAVIIAGILFSSVYHGMGLSGLLPKQNGNKSRFQNGLVLLQMTLSVIFLTSTIIVYKQIYYMHTKDIGIALNEVVVCTGPASMNLDPLRRQRYEGFKSELLSFPEFQQATFNNYVPGQHPRYGFSEMHNPITGVRTGVSFHENNAGEGLIETYQMKLLAGSDFHISEDQNINKIIINQTASNLLGFNDARDAVGQQVYRVRAEQQPLEIIGVVSDFHNEGLQKAIYPIFWNNSYPFEFGYIVIRLNSSNINATINQLQKIWNKHYPNDDLDFAFANEKFNLQYVSEKRFGRFYLWLTILSIGIASMGLYGLILFRFGKRTKEIGIHKVHGAHTHQVMWMLLKEFAKWVVIAFIIATPVAWYIMQKWLDAFAYRVEISWWVYALAGVITLSITMITVSWQSRNTARKNPVHALRYE